MNALVCLMQVEGLPLIVLLNELHRTRRVEIGRVEDIIHNVIAWKFVLPHVLLARACVDRTVLRPLPPSVAPVVVLRGLQISDVRVETSVDWQVMRGLVPQLELVAMQ